jgi:LuxR family maltose regulon positive regulatory protein
MWPITLRSKLRPPPRRAVLVRRARLVARLGEGVQHPLTLVSAPAGFGKTTLAAEVALEAADLKWAWLSLDDDDNDPAQFFAYLIAALQTVEAGIGDAALDLLRSPQPPPLKAILAALINEWEERVTQPCVVVLDDYHAITTPAIHEALAYLLAHIPPTLRLLITSRADPPLSLAQLRARAQLVEMRAEELRFTRDEAAAFLRQVMNLTLSDLDVGVLDERTEGWAAGLQFAALALQSQPPERVADTLAHFRGSHRYVMDYLMEQVLLQQPESRRTFMVESSILDRLCASLCDAVTKRDDSQAMLAELERLNLFLLPLDEQREWYRFHPLLGDVLRAQLDPARAALLHRRAAAWAAAHESPGEAIRHALLAHDWTHAVEWIKSYVPRTILGGEFVRLRRWIDQLPDAILEADSDLLAYQGWLAWLAGDVQVAGLYAGKAQAALSADAAGANRGRLLALQAELSLTCEENALALEQSQAALALIGEADPFFGEAAQLALASAQQAVGDIPAALQTWSRIVARTGRCPSLLAVAALAGLILELNWQGKRHEALDLCQRALGEYVDSHGHTLPVGGMLYAALAALEYESNELEAAQEHVTRGLELCEQLELTGAVVACHFSQAQVLYARGEQAAALAALRTARRMAGDAQFVGYALSLAAFQASIELERGNVEAAARWAEQAHLPLGGTPDPARESEYLTYARLMLAQSRAREAGDLLSRLEAAARARGRAGRLIRIHLLQARAALALGSRSQANKALAEAVRLAAPQAYRRAFLDEPALVPLLSEVRSVAPRFVDEVLAAARREPQPAASALAALEEALNEREMEILRLIADGLTNAEIAGRLSLARSTVKWHINNLYAKLDARTRTQALARAREAGLL